MQGFQTPKASTSGIKRKFEGTTSPENAKKPKPSPLEFMQSPMSTSGKFKSLSTIKVEDEPEEAAPTEVQQEEFAPGNDADYFVEEDEEGRFFGTGLTREQKDILNIFEDGAEGVVADIEELNLPAIRRLLLKLERTINKNQDQRSKYPNDPTKFIDSEADLDAALKALMPLSQVPALAYPELAKSENISMLIGLLSHENMDIVIDVVELIDELTDEDVGGEEDDADQDESEQKDRDASMKMLANAFTKHSLLELLVSNFNRFNEEEESDRQGLFHVLGIFENMIALNPPLAGQIVEKTSFLTWILSRIQAPMHDENRGYAAELLAILLQNDRNNRLAFAKKNGMEVVLPVLAGYRKRDPETADEEEFMENLFDALCSALQEPENKKLFTESEGVDLMLIMMREKLMARSRAIKVLDNALSGASGAKNCEIFVEALGLKPLFAAFMGKLKKSKTETSALASEETSHVLGMLSSLFTNLASESPERIRLLTKFVEGEYEKVDRLLDVRESVETRLRVVDKEIAAERKEMQRNGEEIGDMEDLWYLRRLDGGLFTLQTVDYILGWICMEDDGVRNHASVMLGRKSKGLKDIISVLKNYRDNIGDTDDMEVDGADETVSRKEILDGLLGFLETCV